MTLQPPSARWKEVGKGVAGEPCVRRQPCGGDHHGLKDLREDRSAWNITGKGREEWEVRPGHRVSGHGKSLGFTSWK